MKETNRRLSGFMCPFCDNEIDYCEGEEEGYSGEYLGHPVAQTLNLEWYECPKHGDIPYTELIDPDEYEEYLEED
jgi:hypothetical protein